jgi:branched-chain amino acid transport system substrate-binding protein
MEARFKEINAAGGINGRKITWVVDDTTSTSTGAETAAKNMVQNQGVFAIAELSSEFFGAAPYLAQAGIPATGEALDGPEWYEQPNTNLFSVTGNGTPNGEAYGDGGFYKAIGATKISYVESNISAAISEGNSVYDSIARDGFKACDKTIVPLGSVNFTAFALSFKSDGCNAAECACVLSSSLAMATALHQAGLTKVKDHLRRRSHAADLPERRGRGGRHRTRTSPGSCLRRPTPMRRVWLFWPASRSTTRTTREACPTSASPMAGRSPT